MLQNTPENKRLTGWHPHNDRKQAFAVCYCIITL
jgi:isopropylmalate/homocitrate/citramalate synthase